MIRLTGRNVIRARLQADPVWAVYALADLDPGAFEHAEWFTPHADCAAVALVYRAFDRPILWAAGTPEELRPLADSLFEPATLRLQVRNELAAWIGERYRSVELKPMWRLGLRQVDFSPRPAPGCRPVRLTDRHLAGLGALYATGESAGEAPDFFQPSMLDTGVFYGAVQDGMIVAAAGTHVFSVREGAAAIGNVFTHPEYRGRGLAQALTSAVASELFRLRTETLALSVHRDNAPALAAYKRLGFKQHCEFYEGLAAR
jgi:GNAT superfamily N-acetyltransferase